MDDDRSHLEPSPFGTIPTSVLAIFFVIFGIECLFAGAEAGLFGGPTAIGWRLGAMETYGFSPLVFDWMFSTWQFPGEHLLRFLTYPFLHYGFVHMIFAAVIFLAMGKYVGEAMGGWTVPVLFFACTILGASIFALIVGDARGVLVGAYPGAYGLIGAFTFVLWVRARATGGAQLQAFSLIGFLMGIQLIFGVLFGTDNTWIAELAGFCVGFVLSFVLVPGGVQFLLRKLRGE